MQPLSQIAVGSKGRIAAVTLPPATRQRLQEMGLTTGVECTLVRVAPMGDPIEVRVRGYNLSLRKSEAQGVLLSDATPAP